MNKKRRLIIKDGEDFEEKLNIAYELWRKNNFNSIWYEYLSNRWHECCAVDVFMKYLLLRRELNEEEFLEKIKPEILFLNSMDEETKNLFLKIGTYDRPILKIENEEMFKNKINYFYKKWEEFKYSEIYLECIKRTYKKRHKTVDTIIELLHKKKDLSHDDYAKLEKDKIDDYVDTKRMIENLFKIRMAENEAFEKAGITEGRVEYICPICGNIAVANRYMFNGSYHSLGSGCKNCGIVHS